MRGINSNKLALPDGDDTAEAPESRSSRTILEEAADDARIVLCHDPQLKRLLADYRRAALFDDSDDVVDGYDRITDLMHRIDEMAQFAVLHALRRQGLRWIRIEVLSVPSTTTARIFVKLKQRGRKREARIEMEINPS